MSLKTTNFTFDVVKIWEWYDGIVRAVGSRQQENYLMVLVAWDTANDGKAYVLVELKSDAAEAMKRLEANSEDLVIKQRAWDSFEDLFETYISSYNGPVYLTYLEPKVGQVNQALLVDSVDIRTLTNYDLENTFEKSTCRFWFGLKSWS